MPLAICWLGCRRRLPVPVAVAVALGHPERRLLAPGSAGGRAYLHLHQLLGSKAIHLAQEIGIRALFSTPRVGSSCRRFIGGPFGYLLRVEYDLTPAGESLVPLIDALGDWWERSTGNLGNPDAYYTDIADSPSAQPRLMVNRVLGYTGSADPLTQVQLPFSTREAAINYARSQGMNFFVQQDVSECRKGRKHQPSLKYSQVPTECGQPYCLPKEEPAAGAAGPVA